MSGICGRLDFAGETVERQRIARLCELLAHRGPDGEGIHVAPGIGLGQRRLAVIDPDDRTAAPPRNEDGSIRITFDGAIYNHRELRAELRDRGHAFRTGSDAEVLVHLYEECGASCLQRLRGMFSFAIWDARRRLLFGARDRLGQKPFLYARTARSLVFASEIAAVLADPDVSNSPDFAAIDAYLQRQYVPSPLTAFIAVRRLPAAHYFTCGMEGALEVRRYWIPPAPEPVRASKEEIERELLSRLRDAVGLVGVSDVPLGVFLSGGIDSGAIVALMAQESDGPVRTFSIGFEEQAFNELPDARQVAQRYGTEHHEFVVRPRATELLPRLVHQYGEPFADSSALPTFCLSHETRKHVTVALSGDGGDESFAGYPAYAQVARWERPAIVPAVMRGAIWRGAGAAMDALPYLNSAARISRAAHMATAALPERYALQMTLLKPQERAQAYTPQLCSLVSEARAAGSAPAELAHGPEWDGSMDAYGWMMRHDQSNYLPDCLMVKVDIASMANGLQVRSPFLDHELVTFAAGIPSSLKINGTGGKAVLRSALRSLLPPDIMRKRKAGFGIPVAEWLRGELNLFLRGHLLDEVSRRRGLFERRFIARMVREHETGWRNWSNRLWALLCLEIWFRDFVD